MHAVAAVARHLARVGRGVGEGRRVGGCGLGAVRVGVRVRVGFRVRVAVKVRVRVRTVWRDTVV